MENKLLSDVWKGDKVGMTIKKIIDGLYFNIGMMLFNPMTGEGKTPDELNEDDRYTYDACMGAIKLLKAQEQEIEDLKQEIEGHKDNLRETLDEMMRYADELRAQEPRVMTLGDLRDIGSVWELNTPPYLWMEINPSYRWTRGFWVAWREIYDMIDGLHPTYDADNYGKIWRCWTSRPTNEQREGKPWN